MKKSHKRRRGKPSAQIGKTSPPVPPIVKSRLQAKAWLFGIPIVLGVLLFALVKAGLHRAPAGGQTHSAAGGPGQRLAGNSSLPNTGATNSLSLASQGQKDGAAAAFNTQANNLLKAGDVTGAIQSYRQALTLSPNDEDLHFNLGIAYARSGDVTNAEREYREALRLLPDYPEVHNNLGNLLLRSGRLEEARQQFTEALKEMPEYAQAQNNLGIVHQRQNRPAEALACFQKAVESETNYWEAHFNLASAYLHQNEKDKAIVELRETLRINPSFEAAQKTLDKVLGKTTASPAGDAGAPN